MSDPQQPLRVTLEELADAARSEPTALVSAAEQPAVASPAAKSYGNINATPDAPALLHEKGSILLQAWFYLGLAGLLGALAGWGIAEPGFVDAQKRAPLGQRVDDTASGYPDVRRLRGCGEHRRAIQRGKP